MGGPLCCHKSVSSNLDNPVCCVSNFSADSFSLWWWLMKRNGRTPKTDRTRGTYNKIIRFSNPHLDTFAVVIRGKMFSREAPKIKLAFWSTFMEAKRFFSYFGAASKIGHINYILQNFTIWLNVIYQSCSNMYSTYWNKKPIFREVQLSFDPENWL